ncbi:MAG: hypothetical protein GW949_03040 [Spirochaetales bacterium]|nr:hypothetical protein [Spirochaetales bacterium]
MPWKLLLTLILFSLFVAFTGFNLENTSAISFGFVTFSDVPIFLSLSISFLAGAFYSIPYALISRKKKNPSSPTTVNKEKKKFGRKSKQNSLTNESELSQGGTYIAEADTTPSSPRV